MGKIVTLSERALAKAGSVLERVDPDKLERLGDRIKGIVGQKAFGKIDEFAGKAEDALYNRRIQEEKDPARRAMMLGEPVNGSARQFIRNDRSGDRSL